MAVPLYGMTLKCSKCGVVSSAEVSATATSNAMLVPLISTSFLSFFPLLFFYFIFFPLPFPCTHQPLFVFSPHLPAHRPTSPTLPDLILWANSSVGLLQHPWSKSWWAGSWKWHDMPRCVHVSSPWKTKGLFVCWELGLHLIPPFNLVLEIVDLNVWFPLIFMVASNSSFVEHLSVCLRFLLQRLQSAEYDLSELVNHF